MTARLSALALAASFMTNAGDAEPSAVTRFTIAPGSNRLTAANDNAGGGRSFTHDARGNLTGETRAYVGGGTASVSASYDDYGMLAIVSRDSVSAAATTDWVHSDHLGGLVSLVDASGTQVMLGSCAYSLPQAPGQHRTLDDLYYNRYRDC